jgi:very-short-patch-repair endonuclease
LNRADYETQHGSIICQSSKNLYKDSKNYDWINREKSRGNDLSDWKEKLSEKISQGIMNSQTARQARRDNLSNLNRSKEFRERSSETAKKTSSRLDVLEQRTMKLKKWRDENTELFYDSCVKKMISSYQSIPEQKLFDLIDTDFPLRFKKNQQIRRIGKFISVKSGTRQIDILDLQNKIVIEFDGPRHFFNYAKQDYLMAQKVRDEELNRVLVGEGFTVIRVAFDQFSYKNSGKFNDSCLQLIRNTIVKQEPGLILIGDAYRECSHVD